VSPELTNNTATLLCHLNSPIITATLLSPELTNNNSYLAVSPELTNNRLRIPSTDAAMNTKIQDTHEETALMFSLDRPFQRSEF